MRFSTHGLQGDGPLRAASHRHGRSQTAESVHLEARGPKHLRPASALLLLVLALVAAPAQARISEAQQRYEQEHRVCTKGRSNQDRANCLREAASCAR